MKVNVKRALEENKIAKAMRMGMYAAFLVLNGESGWGKKRLTRFGLSYFKTLDDYLEKYGEVAMEAMFRDVKARGFSDTFSEMDWRKNVDPKK